MMQSYSRAKSIKAGRGHGPWEGLHPTAGSLSGHCENCVSLGHPRSDAGPLVTGVDNGRFKDF